MTDTSSTPELLECLKEKYKELDRACQNANTLERLGYTSMFRIHGQPILPPVISDEQRAEILRYQQLAMEKEFKVKWGHRQRLMSKVHKVLKAKGMVEDSTDGEDTETGPEHQAQQKLSYPLPYTRPGAQIDVITSARSSVTSDASHTRLIGHHDHRVVYRDHTMAPRDQGVDRDNRVGYRDYTSTHPNHTVNRRNHTIDRDSRVGYRDHMSTSRNHSLPPYANRLGHHDHSNSRRDHTVAYRDHMRADEDADVTCVNVSPYLPDQGTSTETSRYLHTEFGQQRPDGYVPQEWHRRPPDMNFPSERQQWHPSGGYAANEWHGQSTSGCNPKEWPADRQSGTIPREWHGQSTDGYIPPEWRRHFPDKKVSKEWHGQSSRRYSSEDRQGHLSRGYASKDSSGQPLDRQLSKEQHRQPGNAKNGHKKSPKNKRHTERSRESRHGKLINDKDERKHRDKQAVPNVPQDHNYYKKLGEAGTSRGEVSGGLPAPAQRNKRQPIGAWLEESLKSCSTTDVRDGNHTSNTSLESASYHTSLSSSGSKTHVAEETSSCETLVSNPPTGQGQGPSLQGQPHLIKGQAPVRQGHAPSLPMVRHVSSLDPIDGNIADIESERMRRVNEWHALVSTPVKDAVVYLPYTNSDKGLASEAGTRQYALRKGWRSAPDTFVTWAASQPSSAQAVNAAVKSEVNMAVGRDVNTAIELQAVAGRLSSSSEPTSMAHLHANDDERFYLCELPASVHVEKSATTTKVQIMDAQHCDTTLQVITGEKASSTSWITAPTEVSSNTNLFEVETETEAGDLQPQLKHVHTVSSEPGQRFVNSPPHQRQGFTSMPLVPPPAKEGDSGFMSEQTHSASTLSNVDEKRQTREASNSVPTTSTTQASNSLCSTAGSKVSKIPRVPSSMTDVESEVASLSSVQVETNTSLVYTVTKPQSVVQAEFVTTAYESTNLLKVAESDTCIQSDVPLKTSPVASVGSIHAKTCGELAAEFNSEEVVAHRGQGYISGGRKEVKSPAGQAMTSKSDSGGDTLVCLPDSGSKPLLNSSQLTQPAQQCNSSVSLVDDTLYNVCEITDASTTSDHCSLQDGYAPPSNVPSSVTVEGARREASNGSTPPLTPTKHAEFLTPIIINNIISGPDESVTMTNIDSTPDKASAQMTPEVPPVVRVESPQIQSADFAPKLSLPNVLANMQPGAGVTASSIISATVVTYAAIPVQPKQFIQLTSAMAIQNAAVSTLSACSVHSQSTMPFLAADRGNKNPVENSQVEAADNETNIPNDGCLGVMDKDTNKDLQENVEKDGFGNASLALADAVDMGKALDNVQFDESYADESSAQQIPADSTHYSPPEGGRAIPRLRALLEDYNDFVKRLHYHSMDDIPSAVEREEKDVEEVRRHSLDSARIISDTLLTEEIMEVAEKYRKMHKNIHARKPGVHDALMQHLEKPVLHDALMQCSGKPGLASHDALMQGGHQSSTFNTPHGNEGGLEYGGRRGSYDLEEPSPALLAAVQAGAVNSGASPAPKKVSTASTKPSGDPSKFSASSRRKLSFGLEEDDVSADCTQSDSEVTSRMEAKKKTVQQHKSQPAKFAFVPESTKRGSVAGKKSAQITSKSHADKQSSLRPGFKPQSVNKSYKRSSPGGSKVSLQAPKGKFIRNILGDTSGTESSPEIQPDAKRAGQKEANVSFSTNQRGSPPGPGDKKNESPLEIKSILRDIDRHLKDSTVGVTETVQQWTSAQTQAATVTQTAAANHQPKPGGLSHASSSPLQDMTQGNKSASPQSDGSLGKWDQRRGKEEHLLRYLDQLVSCPPHDEDLANGNLAGVGGMGAPWSSGDTKGGSLPLPPAQMFNQDQLASLTTDQFVSIVQQEEQLRQRMQQEYSQLIKQHTKQRLLFQQELERRATRQSTQTSQPHVSFPPAQHQFSPPAHVQSPLMETTQQSFATISNNFADQSGNHSNQSITPGNQSGIYGLQPGFNLSSMGRVSFQSQHAMMGSSLVGSGGVYYTPFQALCSDPNITQESNNTSLLPEPFPSPAILRPGVTAAGKVAMKVPEQVSRQRSSPAAVQTEMHSPQLARRMVQERTPLRALAVSKTVQKPSTNASHTPKPTQSPGKTSTPSWKTDSRSNGTQNTSGSELMRGGRNFDTGIVIYHKLEHLPGMVKGYLTRRLFRTSRVQEIIKKLADTAQFALDFQTESPVKRGDLNQQDQGLQDRIFSQLNASLYEIHEIFFETSIKERMEMISQDRALVKERLFREKQSAELKRKRLSAATVKSIERRRKMQELDKLAKSVSRSSPPAAEAKARAYSAQHLEQHNKRSSESSVGLQNQRQYRQMTSKIVKPNVAPSSPKKITKHRDPRREQGVRGDVSNGLLASPSKLAASPLRKITSPARRTNLSRWKPSETGTMTKPKSTGNLPGKTISTKKKSVLPLRTPPVRKIARSSQRITNPTPLF